MDIEKRVEDCITERIEDATHLSMRKSIKKHLNRCKRWEDTKRRFFALSDPDAAQIIPSIVKLFENKKEQIDESELTSDEKDLVLLKLDLMRKELGLEERERKIKK